MTQTGIPASGMWGAGDYEGFRTLEQLEFDNGMAGRLDVIEHEIMRREIIKEAFLSLAHDLDARGLVTVPSEPTEAMLETGSIGVFSGQECTFEDQALLTFDRMVARGVTEFPPLPPDPNTGS